MNKNQTAVKWLYDWLRDNCKVDPLVSYDEYLKALSKAEEMEKEMIMKAARQCHFEGVRQSAKTSQEYIAYAEQYYNETYNERK